MGKESDFKQSISGEDKKTLRVLMSALEPVRATYSAMTLSQLNSFMLVGLEEGQSNDEYAAKANLSKSVMSRHLLDLGTRNRNMEPGLGLVAKSPNPFNLRKHQVYLTGKGKALIDKIVREIKK